MHYVPGRKKHLGYIVDRADFVKFKKLALGDMTLPDITEVTPHLLERTEA